MCSPAPLPGAGARPRALGAGRLTSAAHQALPIPARRPLRHLSSARRAAWPRPRPPRQAPAAHRALKRNCFRPSAALPCSDARQAHGAAAPQYTTLQRPCPSGPSAQGAAPGQRPCGAGAPPPASPGAAHLRSAPARRADNGSLAPKSGGGRRGSGTPADPRDASDSMQDLQLLGRAPGRAPP